MPKQSSWCKFPPSGLTLLFQEQSLHAGATDICPEKTSAADCCRLGPDATTTASDKKQQMFCLWSWNRCHVSASFSSVLCAAFQQTQLAVSFCFLICFAFLERTNLRSVVPQHESATENQLFVTTAERDILIPCSAVHVSISFLVSLRETQALLSRVWFLAIFNTWKRRCVFMPSHKNSIPAECISRRNLFIVREHSAGTFNGKFQSWGKHSRNFDTTACGIGI